MNAGEYRVPIANLRSFVEKEGPEARAIRTEARGWLAYALNESGDPEGALAELAPALDEDPRDPWLHYERGRSWTTIGEYEQAIDAYRQSAELDPSFVRTWQWLGHCLLLVGRPQEALGADTRALEIAEQADARCLAYWKADRRGLLREILIERASCLDVLGDHEAAGRDRARAEELRGADF